MIVDAGNQGFFWFIGKVESRDDPLQLGRLKVRVYNIHPQNEVLVSTDELPWATVMTPATSASVNHIGTSPVGIVAGTTVVGFFMDGRDAQIPVVMGTLAGIPKEHDVPPRARGIDNLSDKIAPIGNEPPTAFSARYPFNKVTQTEGGHVVELDDTPGSERINVFHKSGSYIEINEEGRRVQKIVGDDYEIVKQDKNVYVKGSLNIIVEGSADINVSRACNISATLPLTLKSTSIISMTAPVVSINGSLATSVKGKVLGLNTDFGDMFGSGEASVDTQVADEVATTAADAAEENIVEFTSDTANLEEVMNGGGANGLSPDVIQEIDDNLSTKGFEEFAIYENPSSTSAFEKIRSNIGSIYKGAAASVVQKVGPVIKEASNYGVSIDSVATAISKPEEAMKNICLSNVSKFSAVIPDGPQLAAIKEAGDNEYVQTALRVVIRSGGDPKQFIAACTAEVQELAIEGINNTVAAEMPKAVAEEILPAESTNVTRVSIALKDSVSAISKATAETINKVYGVADTAKSFFEEKLPDDYKRYTNTRVGG